MSAPAAICKLSPARNDRAVCKVPYHNIFEEFMGLPSNKTIPEAAPGDENGPNKSEAVFDADCVGDAAAPKSAVTRLKLV